MCCGTSPKYDLTFQVTSDMLHTRGLKVMGFKEALIPEIAYMPDAASHP